MNRTSGETINVSADLAVGRSLSIGSADASASGRQTDGENIVLNARDRIQVGSLNAGNGDIEITSNSIELTGGANSVNAQSITLQPDSPSLDIWVGGQSDTADVLNLSVVDIAALGDGLGTINIGRSDGTGRVTLFADSADSTGNGFMSPVRIRGASLTLAGPDLDTIWTLDRSSGGNLVNTVSTHRNVSFGKVAGIVGGRNDDTINFLSPRVRVSSLIDGGAGDLTLVGDDFYLPRKIRGEGDLFIRTLRSTIELGGRTDPGRPFVANLLNRELLHLVRADFESITVGSESGRGITLMNDFTFDSALTLMSGDRIDTTAGNLTTTGRSPLTLIARGDIDAGDLGATGDISLVSSEGNITATSIDARGVKLETQDGGDIAVSAANGTVRVSGYVGDDSSNSSVQTDAGNTIIITHGGNGTDPFTVGSRSLNGVAGAITNQTNTVAQATFWSSFTDEGLSILTRDLAVEPSLEEGTTEMVSSSVDRLWPPLYVATDETFGSFDLTILLSNLEERAAQEVFSRIEMVASNQFKQFLSIGDGEASTQVATLPQVQDTLFEARKNLAVRPALIYVYFVPDVASTDTFKTTVDRQNAFLQESNPNDQLEVMLISEDGSPIRRRQWGVTRAAVESVAKSLRYEATSQFSRPQEYLLPAQQLYRWIVQPLRDDLNDLGVDNLSFIMDDGLRTIPLAVLHDGDSFLVEQYSLGLMPTFSLTDLATAPVDSLERANSQVLAMGASRFSAQPSLPGVAAELSLVADGLWQGEAFLNEHFTLENLRKELRSDRYNILHLATHAVFNAGDWDNSYIQLWDERVTLSKLNDLGLKRLNIGLIILSACNTALGDRASEYGFAGFAVNAGSESALASLWPVSDEGTLGFMTQFYQNFSEGKLRSEALRAAQISMLRGEVGIVDGRVEGPGGEVLAVIPELAESGNWDFSHPFYWSAFTMIGNPW